MPGGKFVEWGRLAQRNRLSECLKGSSESRRVRALDRGITTQGWRQRCRARELKWTSKGPWSCNEVQTSKEIEMIKLLLVTVVLEIEEGFQRQYRILRESKRPKAQEAQSTNWRSEVQRILDLSAVKGQPGVRWHSKPIGTVVNLWSWVWNL